MHMISFRNCWKPASLNHHWWNESQLGAETRRLAPQSSDGPCGREQGTSRLSAPFATVSMWSSNETVCSVETARRELHQSGGDLLQAAAPKQSFCQRPGVHGDLACSVTLQSRPPADRRKTVSAPCSDSRLDADSSEGTEKKSLFFKVLLNERKVLFWGPQPLASGDLNSRNGVKMAVPRTCWRDRCLVRNLRA